MQGFVAPRWLPGGHAQTIWPALFSRRRPPGPALALQRERWTTPDGDFIDVDLLAAPPRAAANGGPAPPMLVLFHGLEGSSASHYAQAFGHWARQAGWAFAVPHFRGCSGELNLAPRAYHSGDFEEIGWILGRLRLRFGVPLYAAGVSLGGNALMRWAAEAGDTARGTAAAVAAISSPLDLPAAGAALDRGFNRLVYARMFLSTLKPKALRKWQQHPGLFDRERMLQARTIHAFDDAFTAPVHGFAGTDDYWRRAAARPHLARVRVPALALNARNDPFVPAHSLPLPHEVGAHVTLSQPVHGGHVGFPGGHWPGHLKTLPEQVTGWLAQHF